MPATFVVDQAATFSGVAFLSSVPKIAFGSEDQERTKDGTPRWEIQLVGGFRDSFGRVQNEVIKVSVNAHHNPGEGLTQFTPVHMKRLEVGVMERQRDGEIVGVQVWYRAQAIEPTDAVPGSRRPEAVKAAREPWDSLTW